MPIFITISSILNLNIHQPLIYPDLPVFLEPNSWAGLHDLLHQLAFCHSRNLFSKLPTLELHVSTTIFTDEISSAQRWERHGSEGFKGTDVGRGGDFFRTDDASL